MPDKETDFVDGVIVAWHPNRHGGSGFVRIPELGESLYLRGESIITMGAETLRVGSRVRCRVAAPNPGYTTRIAVDVEIYLN